jgi:hypothetical protein
LRLAGQSSSFRKIQRPNGPVMKKVDPGKSIITAGPTVSMITSMGKLDLEPAPMKEVQAYADTTTAITKDSDIASAANASLGRSTFKFTVPNDTQSTGGPNSIVASEFQGALQIFEEHFDSLNWTPEVEPDDLDQTSLMSAVAAQIDPLFAVPRRIYNGDSLSFSDGYTLPAPDEIVPILAAPNFRQPMYKSIADLSVDLLIPNLNLIPQNTISLLETNQKFIESYMVGINHEMGRELLWREYPTDQRGTYFKHFWDTNDRVNTEAMSPRLFEEANRDIGNIHEWSTTTRLGTHNERSSEGVAEAKLVLVLRGDLLKKFPNAVIYAVQAEWQKDEFEQEDYSLPRIPAYDKATYPSFGAKIEPDINFIGFDLTIEDARGTTDIDPNDPPANPDPGYFFVIKERPGEPRFGFDIEDASNPIPETWNDLAFNHVEIANSHVDLVGPGNLTPPNSKIPDVAGIPVTWGKTSADMAMISFQNPFLVAIHAKEMLLENS